MRGTDRRGAVAWLWWASLKSQVPVEPMNQTPDQPSDLTTAETEQGLRRFHLHAAMLGLYYVVGMPMNAITAGFAIDEGHSHWHLAG